MNQGIKTGKWAVWAGIALLCGSAGTACAADLTPALKELIQAANKEGQVDVMWAASNLGGPAGAKLFEERMAKLYNAKVKVRWIPGRSMPEVGNEIAMRQTNRLPAPTDVYYGFSRNLAELAKYNLFLSAPWESYAPGRLTSQVVEQNGTMLKLSTTYTGLAINKKLAPYIPTSLDDLLKPEWKGKLATTPYGAGFDMIASKDIWGAERSIAWAKKFSSQVSGLMRCSDMDRILSGEFLGLVTDCGGDTTLAAMSDGAPLEQVITKELNIVSFFYLAVPKSAPHPNAAKLLTVYLLSEDGQKNLEEMRGGMTLHLFPGSKTGDRIHKLEAEWNKKFVLADVAWQLKNEEGNQAQRVIKDILTQGKQ